MATIDDMMTSLANAVRSKAGVTGKLSITAMTNAVNSISVGSGDFDFSGASSDIADYLMVGYKAFDNTGTLVDGEAENYTDHYSYLPVRTVIGWGGEGSYGEIFMTPTVSNTAVVSNESMIYAQVEGLIPSNIKKGVTIGNLTGTYEGITIDNPIYDTAVTKNITASDTYTFSTYSEAMINISPGWYKYGIDVVCRMDNLIASNIKSGVSILGITGTYEGGSSVDLSGVTASSGTVLKGYKFVDKNGSLIEGSIVTRSASTDAPGTVTFQAGYYPNSFDAFIVAGNVAAVNVTKADVREGISFIGADGFIDIGTMEASSGDSTVKFGYWTAEGKFQEIDLSGDSPVDIGEPVEVDAQMFATGKPTPEYPSSGGGMEFYECASVGSGESGGGGAGGDSTAKAVGINVTYPNDTMIEGGYYPTESDPKRFAHAASSGAAFIRYSAPSWYLYNIMADVVDSAIGADGDATIEEICALPWGAATLTPIYEDASAAVSESGSAVTTWSGYKMEWREGSSSPAVSAIRISGTTNGVADGDYVSDTTLTGADRKFINTSNANAFIVWDGDGWALSLNGTNRVAVTNTDNSGDMPTSSIEYICSVGFRVMLWGNDVIGSTGDAVSAEAVTIGGGGSPAGWYKTDTLTEGLEVKGYYPVVGKIYNQDTTIEVKKAFDGVLIPIPQNGLVFYAPLQTDYVDIVSGASASVTGGSFTTYNNKDCLYLQDSYISWGLNSDLPIQANPVSIVMLVSPYDGDGQRTYISIGDESVALPLQIQNGSVLEWGSGSISSDGNWKSVIVTRDSDLASKTYINGELTGSGSISFSPSRSFVCVGALSSYGYIQKINAYVRDTAVYNRVLTADEVLEIHNTLMNGVTA